MFPESSPILRYNGRDFKYYYSNSKLVASYPGISGNIGVRDYIIKNKRPIPPEYNLLDPSEISATNIFREYIDPYDRGEYYELK